LIPFLSNERRVSHLSLFVIILIFGRKHLTPTFGMVPRHMNGKGTILIQSSRKLERSALRLIFPAIDAERIAIEVFSSEYS
jgi:hypothetical protein